MINELINIFSVYFCCELTPVESTKPEPSKPEPLKADFGTTVQRLWTAYEKGINSDLIIQTSGKDFNVILNRLPPYFRCYFQVHRLIFGLQSPVFQAMISNKNFVEGQTGMIKIRDIELPVLEALIRWMYTGEVQNPDVVVDELCKVADAYQIDDLKV